jgi:quercetin dioxygenase-like cupin family protein
MDVPPNFTGRIHRTTSLDYCIVMQGEITLKLDSGEEKGVKAGDLVIQQGVNHQWVNREQIPCRLAFIVIAAEKVQLDDGTVLE